MTKLPRRARAGASVLVSLALGAVFIGLLLDRPKTLEQPSAAKPPPARVKAVPVQQDSPKPHVAALRLPPPPSPPKPRIPEQPPRVTKTLPPPPPRPPKKEPDRIKRERHKLPPRPARAVPKPAVTKRPLPESPPIIRRKDKTPISLAPKPKTRPVGREKPVSAPEPESRAPAGAATVVPTRATRREGRTLLRLLEYGKGPAIEIAWPDAEGRRARLYRSFRDCFGMRNAVMAADGRLYGEAGRSGTPWAINLDRYSGFVRHPAGRMAAAERTRMREISARHGIDGRAVRVFPRNVDAVILGGLHQLIGDDYRNARTITAAYANRRGRLILGAIRVNGQPREGVVDIGAVKRHGCRV